MQDDDYEDFDGAEDHNCEDDQNGDDIFVTNITFLENLTLSILEDLVVAKRVQRSTQVSTSTLPCRNGHQSREIAYLPTSAHC